MTSSRARRGRGTAGASCGRERPVPTAQPHYSCHRIRVPYTRRFAAGTGGSRREVILRYVRHPIVGSDRWSAPQGFGRRAKYPCGRSAAVRNPLCVLPSSLTALVQKSAPSRDSNLGPCRERPRDLGRICQESVEYIQVNPPIFDRFDPLSDDTSGQTWMIAPAASAISTATERLIQWNRAEYYPHHL